MISVKVTKNIIRKGEVGFGLTLSQIIIALCGFAVGAGMFLLLKDVMQIDLLMTLIFIVMALFIAFGVIRINGMTFGKMLLLALKGVDKRPYCVKGVFVDEPVQEKEGK